MLIFAEVWRLQVFNDRYDIDLNSQKIDSKYQSSRVQFTWNPDHISTVNCVHYLAEVMHYRLLHICTFLIPQ